MDMAPIQDHPANHTGMGFRNKKGGTRDDSIGHNSNRVSIQGERPRGRLRKHIEEGLPETGIFMPLGMGGQTAPLGCPMADHFEIFCCGRSREMKNPCIDPPDSIRDISAIDGDLVADEEIFCDIFFDPFPISNFLPNAPSTISNRPNLIRRFLHALAERGSREKDEKEQDQNGHTSY